MIETVSFDFKTTLNRLSIDINTARQDLLGWIASTRKMLDALEHSIEKPIHRSIVTVDAVVPYFDKMLERLNALVALREYLDEQSESKTLDTSLTIDDVTIRQLLELFIVLDMVTFLQLPCRGDILFMIKRNLIEVGSSARQFTGLVSYYYHISHYGKEILASLLRYDQSRMYALADSIRDLRESPSRLSLFALSLGELTEALSSEDSMVRLTAVRLVELWKLDVLEMSKTVRLESATDTLRVVEERRRSE